MIVYKLKKDFSFLRKHIYRFSLVFLYSTNCSRERTTFNRVVIDDETERGRDCLVMVHLKATGTNLVKAFFGRVHIVFGVSSRRRLVVACNMKRPAVSNMATSASSTSSAKAAAVDTRQHHHQVWNSAQEDEEDEEEDGEDEDFVPLVSKEVSSSAFTTSSSSRRTAVAAASRRGTKQQQQQRSGRQVVETQIEMAVFRQKQRDKLSHASDDDGEDRDDDYYYNNNNNNSTWLSRCWGETWRLFASCILAMLLIVPLMKRWYRHHRHVESSNHSNNNTVISMLNWPSNDLVCAKTVLQINFSQLYDQMAMNHTANFCTWGPSSNHRCPCSDPTIPNPLNIGQHQDRMMGWNKTFARNLDLVQQEAAKQQRNAPLDVVLLGDSITERWVGTQFLHPIGRDNSTEYQDIFRQLFNNSNKKGQGERNGDPTITTSVQGLALGISGDRVRIFRDCLVVVILLRAALLRCTLLHHALFFFCHTTLKIPQLLYRMQNGELALPTPPKVWWVLIGINDLLSGGCSKETILVGLLRIIQELQLPQHQSSSTPSSANTNNKKQKTWIVMNSLLPMGDWTMARYRKIWQMTTWINQRLECYVQGLDHVSFYNATDVFLMPYTINQTVTEFIVNQPLMHDLLHPSPDGQRLWGQAIVKHVLELTTK
jgi:lysophospholipase L1-like esterase